MNDLHEVEQLEGGRARFQLTSVAAPEMAWRGARLRLLSAVEGFDDEHEITLNVTEQGETREVDMSPRGEIPLSGGQLTFRYLLSGSTPQADFEYIACFEWAPTGA